jgi:hypothetical protein
MRTFLCLLGLVALQGDLSAESLSHPQGIDFFRDVPSRNLSGLVARSDGMLAAGPRLRSMEGELPAELLWCVRPLPTPGAWVVGAGPEGRLLTLTVDEAAGRFTAKELLRLPDSQVLCVAVLPGGDLLAGTSPHGLLALVREGKVQAQVTLPADSVLDILRLPSGQVLVSTGNPGRIYQVDTTRFAASGIAPDKAATGAELEARGLQLFGEVRDRNLRRLAFVPGQGVVAGSSPKGNLYLFPEKGGAPRLLMENRESEVTDLLVTSDGTLFAALVGNGLPGEQRIQRGQPMQVQLPPALMNQNGPGGGGQGNNQAQQQQNPQQPPELPQSAQAEKFGGRSVLVCVPPGGFPELLASRNGLSVYRLAKHGDWILMAGGEQGDLFGYDLLNRLSLSFPGSPSAQLNDLVPIPGSPDRLLVLRNNLPGLSLLDFKDHSERRAETRRLELPAPSRLGALRIPRVDGIDPKSLRLELRVSSGSEDAEGWSSWQPLEGRELGGEANFGWASAAPLQGRFYRFRLTLPEGASEEALVDKPELHVAAQNRRPVLNEFRLLNNGYEIVPAPEPPAQLVLSLGQVLNQGAGPDNQPERRKAAFLASQVTPSPGTQEFFWNVADPDGDNLVVTFSIRRRGESAWTDVLVNSRESHARIDTSRLPEGLYLTRLIVAEDAPRALAERLSSVFMTEDFLVDHTPPVISSAVASVEGTHLVVTVEGEDALSLLEGVVLAFNNGQEIVSEQTADGLRDQRHERFRVEVPRELVASATAVEVQLYDAAGNRSSQLVKLSH